MDKARKRLGYLKVTFIPENDGKESVDLTCENCGEPISKTSSFGMDCKNDCSQKLFLKNGGPKKVRKLKKLLGI